MDMYQSEKNFLEKIADAIPGLKGYREKEARRDTDKRLRDYIAGRIDGAKKGLEEVKGNLLSEGKLDELDDLDRISQKIFKVANLIRHASYGYSGFFDQVKIQEAELDRIYQYDLSLLADVEALENSFKENPGRTLQEAKKEWQERVNNLEKRIEERKDLFTIAG